jgi:hypothetical protein
MRPARPTETFVFSCGMHVAVDACVRLGMLLVALASIGCAGIGTRFHARMDRVTVPRDPRTVAIYTMTPPGLRYDVVGALHAEEAS